MKKKILISTGGSGGHVIPALAFYDHLKEKFDISLVVDRRGSNFVNKNEPPNPRNIIKNVNKKIYLLLLCKTLYNTL